MYYNPSRSNSVIACVCGCGDEKKRALPFLPSFSFSLRRLVTWQVENGCFLYEIWPGSRQGADKKGRNEQGLGGTGEEKWLGFSPRARADTIASFDRNSGGKDMEGSKESKDSSNVGGMPSIRK